MRGGGHDRESTAGEAGLVRGDALVHGREGVGADLAHVRGGRGADLTHVRGEGANLAHGRGDGGARRRGLLGTRESGLTRGTATGGRVALDPEIAGRGQGPETTDIAVAPHLRTAGEDELLHQTASTPTLSHTAACICFL